MESYREEGSTTTPFDMLIRNHVSRYHVADAAVRGGAIGNAKVRLDEHVILSSLRHELQKIRGHIGKTGEGTWLANPQSGKPDG
jgi:xylulose-5-phosphate/fructose-6-phosphate phosphoketolase